MRIEKLEYYDDEYKWRLAEVDFLPNLNLLVGISGVGKTRILESIKSLKSIANGVSLNGVQWNISFSVENNLEYTWNGQFETREDTTLIDDSVDEEEPAKLISEKLIFRNDRVIAERKGSSIIFDGKETPRLSPFESVINLFKQEDEVTLVKAALDKIIPIDFEEPYRYWRMTAPIFQKFENTSLSTLQNSGLFILPKLSILYKNLPEEFQKIKDTFMTIFPQVSDMRIGTVASKNSPLILSQFLQEVNTVRIKEKGVDAWIDNISSGMLKTLMYISGLYLSPENSVVLIDEFENSLGVNCLDHVTRFVLDNKRLQFMITSHHPYIINNISPAYWKIVTRKAGIVTVKRAEDFHISSSRQKAFVDLINILEDDEDLETV
ncbi:MAG: AAA family ATPase [Symploca sp. SIO2B6]|nr:AAA family ATPase [Symploca sp. SIO2B6]